MRYAVLIYEAPGSYDGLSPDQLDALTGEYMEIRSDPRCIDGGRLQPIDMTTTVRVHDGESLITDGPYADTKEIFGGYFIVQEDALDPVLEIAARIPAARMGGSVEVRPMVEYPR